MQMVMVLTGLTGNEEIDRQRAEEYCRFAAHKGNIPLSPYLCFHGVFKDELAGAVEGFLAAVFCQEFFLKKIVKIPHFHLGNSPD